MSQPIQPTALIISYSADLPIVTKRFEIIEAMKSNQVVIIAGETGSGKTTQLPKLCLEAGFGIHKKIGCTQPRRIAALTVSKRIAEELSVPWGQQVGCKIRFLDESKPNTVIKVMTDGILLAETKRDPLLQGYEVVIIDEAHERSLTIDFLLGYIKNILPRRPDLKLIITSATIDTELFSKAFGGAPIIEVSGRLHPVDIRYQPVVTEEGDAEEQSYVDGAVATAQTLLKESNDGDVLIFMPAERDIREARDRLIETVDGGVEVLPLMGSLNNEEQEKVFKKTAAHRKIIIATNIAETSLTIPNIRYVVDTGLVRMSRYNARTRTKGLPIEKISRSSANQRAGRAGRVRAGVCVRLYGESQFNERPEFSDPEIRRANLAEVILRMKSSQLGDIEDFPFLNPPHPRAIRSGYLILQELGALDENNDLTKTGRELSSLPVDPTIGRMLLQSKKEHSLEEILIIAAALSIQDPRERSFEKRQQADEAHRPFIHPHSDFLTFLNLWAYFQDQAKESRSQNQLRKFCKLHFLSYARMREWLDIHAELTAACEPRHKHPPGNRPDRWSNLPVASATEISALEIKCFDGRYRAIHRSILSGLLGQVAYKIDRNTYQASANRRLQLFPGTSLFERRKDRSSPPPNAKRDRRAKQNVSWIVAGEIMETDRLYARHAASIVPSWIEEIGGHLCKKSVTDPRWNGKHGVVEATEKITVNGLKIVERKIAYARIDQRQAKDIFVRSALMNEIYGLQFPFIGKNLALLEKTALRLAQQRRLKRHILDENLIEFYCNHIQAVSIAELRQFHTVQENQATCLATEQDILGSERLLDDPTQYPDVIDIAGHQVPLQYRYEPTGSKEGVTLQIPISLAKILPPRLLDSIVPALQPAQVQWLLQSLPKRERTKLGDMAEAVGRILCSPEFTTLPLNEALITILSRDFDVTIALDGLNVQQLPEHLKPRFELLGSDNRIVASTRDLASINMNAGVTDKSEIAINELQTPLQRAKQVWEKDSFVVNELENFQTQVVVAKVSHVPIIAFRGIVADGKLISIRLFENQADAARTTADAIDLLILQNLAKEMAEIRKKVGTVDSFKALTAFFLPIKELKEGIIIAAKNHILTRQHRYPPTLEFFEESLSAARKKASHVAPAIIELVHQVLELRRTLVNTKNPYPQLRGDREALLPSDFLTQTPYEQLLHLPRFLKALKVRAERAASDPGRDASKQELVQPYLMRLEKLKRLDPDTPLRWMLEEYKVAVFAPELGTAHPISRPRLDAAFKDIESHHIHVR